MRRTRPLRLIEGAVLTVFVHRNGRTEQVPSLDGAWLAPAAEGERALVWADLAAPSPIEALVLSDTFGFHPLAVEDAVSKSHYPKIEAYDGYLYPILHGIDFQAARHGFATHDVDFFLGPKTGVYGMNVPLPHFPGEAWQFGWLMGIMLAMSGGMLVYFHRKGWI